MKIVSKKQRILIIEDDAALRVTIKSMLYPLIPCEIIEAKNASVALRAMRRIRFDIVLSDYNLGHGQNGQQLLEEAKFYKLLPQTAIFIMLTAETSQNMFLSAMENKPDEYIAKPFNAQQLLHRIQKHYARKQYIRDVDIAMESENWALAIKHCEVLLSKNNLTMHSQLVKMRAELALHIGDLDTAEKYYQEILETRELYWASHGLGVIAYLRNKFPQAIEIFKKIINDAPMYMESYDWLAQAFEANDQPEDAQNILKQAVTFSPLGIVRQRRLGVIAQKNGSAEIAKTAFKAAVELGKSSIHKIPSDCYQLAKIYQQNKEHSEFVKLFAYMRSEFANDPEAQIHALILEIEMLQQQNDLAKIARSAEKLVTLFESMHNVAQETQLTCAKIFYQTGNMTIADKITAHLIQNYINDETLIQSIRDICAKTSHVSNIDTLIDKSRKLFKETNTKAVNVFKQGHFQEAIELLNYAMQEMPFNKSVVLNMALVLIQDMKKNGVEKQKLTQLDRCITKMLKLEVDFKKINQAQIEYKKLKAGI